MCVSKYICSTIFPGVYICVCDRVRVLVRVCVYLCWSLAAAVSVCPCVCMRVCMQVCVCVYLCVRVSCVSILFENFDPAGELCFFCGEYTHTHNKCTRTRINAHMHAHVIMREFVCVTHRMLTCEMVHAHE